MLYISSMIERLLFQIAFSGEWGRQMRFITGPRQSGKTTLAKLKLEREKSYELYYLWDLRTVRNRYKANQLFFTQDRPPGRRKAWVCFDEIHKIPQWKNALKAIFDGASEHYQFIVTGSAKFDIFKKAGDSLAGRYFTFHLFPLLVKEVASRQAFALAAPKLAQDFIQEKLDSKPKAAGALSDLLEYGGFPEPFLRQSKTFLAKWAQDYTDVVIKEDIGALTRIIDKEHLYDLYHLLPEMVGNPLSDSSLASHLELSHPTIKNYLKRLADFYLVFKVHPYSKNIKRALLKAPKGYPYDWTRVSDKGKRFENFVAVQLTALLCLWGEISEDRYSLFYIRTKEREEIDFLICKNNAPWLLIETKLSDSSIPGGHSRLQAQLGGIPLVQLCREEDICQMQYKTGFRISASRFLA